jgi:pimeloyl-ACP methyl ester carboxylesterase
MDWHTLPRARLTGIELPYVEQGKGETVVLVHGSNSDHRIWDRHRQILMSGCRVIAMSQRYFGRRPWPDRGESFNMSTHADDLAEFVANLRIGPVTIVGWSYGGGVALAMAAHNHALVKRMFLYEPSLATFITAPDDAKLALDDRLGLMSAAKPLAAAGDLAGAVRLFMDGVNDEVGAFDRLAPDVRALMIENARTLPLLFAGPTPPAITEAHLRQLAIPITIALGEVSRAAYQIAARTAAHLLPQSKLSVIPGARHLWPVQEPQAFCDAVLAFLDRSELHDIRSASR